MEKLFLCDLAKYICNFVWRKKKNVKKIGQYLGANISRSNEAISFNFDM